MTFYLKCTITSYCSFVLLKQTTVVRILTIAHITQFLNNRPNMSQTVIHVRGSYTSTLHSIWHSWMFKFCNMQDSLPAHSIPLSVSFNWRYTLTHFDNVDAILSHKNTAVLFTKISVFIFLNNTSINKYSKEFGDLFTEIPDFYLVLSLVRRYVVREGTGT